MEIPWLLRWAINQSMGKKSGTKGHQFILLLQGPLGAALSYMFAGRVSLALQFFDKAGREIEKLAQANNNGD